jgi:hypothetical protein
VEGQGGLWCSAGGTAVLSGSCLDATRHNLYTKEMKTKIYRQCWIVWHLERKNNVQSVIDPKRRILLNTEKIKYGTGIRTNLLDFLNKFTDL